MGSLYIGNNNIARDGSTLYTGVNDVARRIEKIYIGDSNGIARLAYRRIPPFSPISIDASSTASATFAPNGYGSGDWGRVNCWYEGYNYGEYILYTWVYVQASIEESYCRTLRDHGYTRVFLNVSCTNRWSEYLYWSASATIGDSSYTYADNATVQAGDGESDGGYYDIPTSGGIAANCRIGQSSQFGTSISDWIRSAMRISFS